MAIDGIGAIMDERLHQIADKRYTLEHDKAHGTTVLIDAALAYLMQARGKVNGATAQVYWPFEICTFKPDDDPLRSLAKAGALLAAAYDVEASSDA
jgi:hypothetical protein